MTSRYSFDPPRSLFRKLLPDGALEELSSLWIWPKGIRLSGEELKVVSDAFVGRRMAIWKASAYWKAATEHLRSKPDVLERLDHFGAFGPCHHLVDEVISSCIVQTWFNSHHTDETPSETVYSDVIWADIGELASVADPLLRWRLGASSAFGFLRDDGIQPLLWARFIQSTGGFRAGSRTLRDLKESSSQLLMERIENRKLEDLTFVVSICASIGIVTSMVCQDAETKYALVLWGKKEELQSAASRLVGWQNMDASEMENWLVRGASFVLST